jgi:hypothetical protein
VRSADSVTETPYSRLVVDGASWPEAGEKLLDELRASRDRYALVADDQQATDVLVGRLTADLGLGAVRLGAALADLDHAPSPRKIEHACGDAAVLADLDVLLWPDLGVPVLAFITE